MTPDLGLFAALDDTPYGFKSPHVARGTMADVPDGGTFWLRTSGDDAWQAADLARGLYTRVSETEYVNPQGEARRVTMATAVQVYYKEGV